MKVFQAVKQSVTTRQAAEHYGLRVRRNGMACCPFHQDRTPSMKLDERFYCFGCGATGDVIDFVSALWGIGKKEAAVRLAEDFGISYETKADTAKKNSNKPIKKRQNLEQRFQKMKTYCIRILTEYLQLLDIWKSRFAPETENDEWHPNFVEALSKQTKIRYLVEVLQIGDVTEQVTLIIEHVEEVSTYEKRIVEFGTGDRRKTAPDNRTDGMWENK